MESLKLLKWDTAFFRFNVARIVNSRADAVELKHAVSQMDSQGIVLAYWAAHQPEAEIHELACSLGGTLVDEKQTFVADLDALPVIHCLTEDQVEPWRDSMSLLELKDLAVQSGGHSRFFVDPKFPRDKAIAMFEEWIVHSIDGTLAEQVLVIRQEQRAAGLVTLCRSGPRGSIGLLSVAEGYRGRRFGEALVRAAMDWCRHQGIRQVQVITQRANVAAGNLYQKCGFELEESASVYHFWA